MNFALNLSKNFKNEIWAEFKKFLEKFSIQSILKALRTQVIILSGVKRATRWVARCKPQQKIEHCHFEPFAKRRKIHTAFVVLSE